MTTHVTQTLFIQLNFDGREELELLLIIDEKKQILKAQLKGIGGPFFLSLLQKWRPQLKGRLIDLPIPKGKEPHNMILREALLKAKGKWDLPYKEKKLCHCRNVSTKEIEMAILSGAKTTKEVSFLTSASTGCGTCQKHVQKLLDYKMKG